MARVQWIALFAGCLVVASVINPAWAGRKLQAPSPLKETTNASQVSLNWSNIGGETGFLIERRLLNGGSFAEIGKTVADITSYKDTLTTADQYEYRVRAYRTAGSNLSYSDYTNAVDVAAATTTDPTTAAVEPTTMTAGDTTTPCQ